MNKSPYDQGWIFKIKIENEAELNELMDFDKYEEYIKGLSEE